MATMAVLSPITNFSTPASTSHISYAKISCSVTSRASLKCAQRFSGRLSRMFSNGRVLNNEVPVRSNSDFVRVECCTDNRWLMKVPPTYAAVVCSLLAESSVQPSDSSSHLGRATTVRSVFRCNCTSHESGDAVDKEDSIEDADEPRGGVAIAVKILQFYKQEISPLLPGSCRFVPTCSEYGMQAFKKYGVAKGAVLTAWRLSRCNPLGGSGFDPPRWFDETRPPPY